MDTDPSPIEQNAEASAPQTVDAVHLMPAVNVVEVNPALGVEAAPKKKREKREPPKVERPPGKTLLPISKVQHIIKADKVRALQLRFTSPSDALSQDIAIVAKEATFLICCATEEFIKRFGEAAMALAEREKRTTMQYKDMGTLPFEMILPLFEQVCCSYCCAEGRRVLVSRRCFPCAASTCFPVLPSLARNHSMDTSRRTG
jgi:histone H3/H4